MKSKSNISKILVPTDFSPEAVNAMKFAAQVARLTEAEVTLLYVLNYPGGSAFDTMMSEFEDPSKNKYVQEVLKDVNEVFQKYEISKTLKNLKVVKKIQIGNPFTNISDEITQNKTDLVIIGTSGAGNARNNNLIGSNTEKVVRRAACPVISVKEEIDLKKLKSIVFPTTFEKESDQLALFLNNFSKLIGAEVKMVFINTPAYFKTQHMIEKAYEKYVTRNKLKDFAFMVYNELTEEKGILHYSADIDADMIAMATHGRKGLSHLFAGSIAEELTRHTKRTLLTLKTWN